MGETLLQNVLYPLRGGKVLVNPSLGVFRQTVVDERPVSWNLPTLRLAVHIFIVLRYISPCSFFSLLFVFIL
jgi:hypothetical protein